MPTSDVTVTVWLAVVLACAFTAHAQPCVDYDICSTINLKQCKAQTNLGSIARQVCKKKCNTCDNQLELQSSEFIGTKPPSQCPPSVTNIVFVIDASSYVTDKNQCGGGSGDYASLISFAATFSRCEHD